MGKPPSDATLLRQTARDLRDAQRQLVEVQQERNALRGQLTKAQQETAEWRRRFDDLLARVPVAGISGEEKR